MNPPNPPKLLVDRVSLSFDRTPVMDHLSLSVGHGEFVSIVGPSGCGKSTLLKLIGGLYSPDTGKIVMDGNVISGQPGHVSYMPQENSLFPWRTVEENVIMSLELSGMRKKAALAEAGPWLRKAGLADYAGAYPHVLSGGMQQRVSFIRSMLSPKPMLCLDEPFGALDALTRSSMQHWLLDLWEAHIRSVLLVTHSIEEALLLSDRIYVFSGRPARVLDEINVPFPRPRRGNLLTNLEFVALRRTIMELLEG